MNYHRKHDINIFPPDTRKHTYLYKNNLTILFLTRTHSHQQLSIHTNYINAIHCYFRRHLWQQEHLASAEDSTVNGSGGGTGAGGNAGATVLSAPSCPGTPPPPYREVMLHRNLYPRAAMAAAAAAARGGDASPATYNV